MPKQTQREQAEELLHGAGFSMWSNRGRYWVMQSPSGAYAYVLGAAGALRRTRRTSAGNYPVTKSFDIRLTGESGVDALRRLARTGKL